MTRHARARAVAVSVAVASWLAVFAGIALATIDKHQSGTGVLIALSALVTGCAAGAWLRRGQR